MNRRDFLNTAALAAAAGFTGWASSASAATRTIPANSKIAHACIGIGGMGDGDLNNFSQHKGTQIVAICDVDKGRLAQAGERFPHARRYTDWRELLATEGDKIDSINAAVPDHMHAAIALAGIRAGKHVYCQKPLCHDVAECRSLAEATKKYGVVTQLGTQMASGAGDRMGVAHLKAGVIGAVKRIVLCSNRTGAIDAYRLLGPRPAPKGTKPPSHLEWNLWLGNAPEREFAPGIYHPMKWRAWQDFGTGWLGDIGCHIFDAVWKGLGLAAPLSVSAKVQESWKDSPARRGDTWPQGQHVTWIFPGNKFSDDKEIPVEWFDGAFFPDEEAQKYAREAGYPKVPEEAALVIGTEGALLLPHQSGPTLVPKAKFANLARPVLEDKRRNHYHHFLDTILGKAKCESHFQQTGPMAEAIILGTVAIRLPDTKLTWDSANLKTDNDAANALLRRSYRKGWELEL